MASREDKLKILLATLGFEEAMKIAPTLTDDAAGDSAAEKKAAEEAELARAASENPFDRKSAAFSLEEQGRLYRNEKRRCHVQRCALTAAWPVCRPVAIPLQQRFALITLRVSCVSWGRDTWVVSVSATLSLQMSPVGSNVVSTAPPN
jgi:hypothetical protein